MAAEGQGGGRPGVPLRTLRLLLLAKKDEIFQALPRGSSRVNRARARRQSRAPAGGRSLGWRGQCRRQWALCGSSHMTIYVPGLAAGAAGRAWPRPGREPEPGPAARPFSGHARVFPPKGLWSARRCPRGLLTSKRSGAFGTGHGSGPEVWPGCWGRLPPALGSPGALKSPCPALLSLKEAF